MSDVIPFRRKKREKLTKEQLATLKQEGQYQQLADEQLDQDKMDALDSGKPVLDSSILNELEAIAKKNKENADRVAKERAAANKSVLRSYRLKT